MTTYSRFSARLNAVWAFLLTLVSLTGLGLSQAQGQDGVQFSIKLLPDGITYQVAMKPNVTVPTGVYRSTSSIQVTILAAPNAMSLIASSIVGKNATTWGLQTVHNPSVPVTVGSSTTVLSGSDYFIIGLTSNGVEIPYVAGQETVLFEFTNQLACAGPVKIWETSDRYTPNPPSQPINVGNDLTVFGIGFATTNVWLGNYNLGQANCVLPSAITITGPGNGGTVASLNPPISGTASPGASVTVTGGPGSTGGPCIATADLNGNWSCTSLTFTSGPASVTATDGTTTAISSFTVAPLVPPTVAIVSPANNGTATTTPTISGTATPNAVVTLTGGPGSVGGPVSVTADNTGAFSNSAITFPAGPASVTAVATNPGGSSTPAVDNFTAVGPASLTVAVPPPGGLTQPITGTATPGSPIVITGPGNTTLCTTTASLSGTFSCPVTVTAGPTTLTVTASGPGGSTSVPVSVSALDVPTVAILSPTTNGTATTTPTISGTATPNAVVTLTGGPGSLGGPVSVTAGPTGAYSTSALTFPAGPASVTAVATNPGGSSTPAIDNFTAVAPPSLTVVQPATPGGLTQPITGTATPGSVIVITGPGNTTLCTTTASVSGTFSCPVTVPTGPSTLTVTAVGPGGNTSVPISVTALDVPTVAITGPPSGASTTLTPVVVGVATPGSSVTLTGPSGQLCTTTASISGSWSCSVNLTSGPQTLTAITSNVGGISAPATVSLTAINTTPPGLTVVQPITPGGTTQPITGTATPGSPIVITGPGNTTLCTTTASVSGTFSCPVTVPSGPSTLTVTAVGPGGSTSVPISVTALDVPTIALTGPANTSTSTSPTVSGTATPGSTVVLTGPGNTTLCTTTASVSGSFSCVVSVPVGPVSVTATATNPGGSSTPTVTSFTVVGPPSLTVVQPATPGGLTQPITGTATPGSVIVITGPGNTTLCTTTASVSGTFSCPVTVPTGPSTLTVTAVGPGGNTSVPISVTALDVPTVAIVSPANNGTATTTPTISGTATPNAVVTLTGGPGSVGGPVSVTAGPTGAFSTSAITFPAGPASVTAVATNPGGTSTPVVDNFTAVAPPSLTVNSPVSGSTTPTNTVVSGTATPGSTVVITGPGPVTLCTTTASVSGTFACPVTLTAGPQTLTVTASNSAGSTTQFVNTTAVATAPDLTVTMGSPTPMLIIGQPSQIPVTITNIGTAPATGQLTFKMTLPAGLITAQSTYAAGNGWTCATVGTQLACSTTNPGSLTTGQSTTFAIQVQPTAPPQSLTLVGRIDPVSGETSLTNNSTTLVVGSTSLTVLVPVKVNLQGALVTETPPLTMMRDDLRAQGLLPTTEPYTSRGYTHHGGGGETTTPAVFSVTGANAIVDWVVVELRSGLSFNTVVATRSALVQRDGDVVDVDGVSSLTFGAGVTIGTSYYVAVHHRNHLGVMAANAVVAAPVFPLTDFTSSATALYQFPVGNLRRSSVPLATEQGKLALWAGDTNGDGFVIAQGPNNDRVPIFTDVINAPGNAASQASNYVYAPTYSDSDVDMDGQIIFQGQFNELNVIIFNVLLHPDNHTNQFNNYVINQQIP